MQSIILRNFQSPGDIVMLTAAVRDLHRCYPDRFLTDVRTSCPELWDNNPYITPLSEGPRDVAVIDCEYPLIHASNQRPVHFLHGFTEYINAVLSLQITPTAFHGDIHLSVPEKSWLSQVGEVFGEDVPFWIIVAGGKRDVTIKWWERERYQKVVDHFLGRILFVQVGASEHHHPPLRNVIDLRGKTNLRQLIRLVYHSHGVLCPVTSLMHLSAAVETKPGMPSLRPCVVVAGGREAAHWEAYPGHQFLHTIGALPCCASGGCWKSRTRPLGDLHENDNPDRLCMNVVENLPKCMDMITAGDVIEKIEKYLTGGSCTSLKGRQRHKTRKYLDRLYNGQRRQWAIVDERFKKEGRKFSPLSINRETFAFRFSTAASTPPAQPKATARRGIVLAGGGPRYLVNAWVAIRTIRMLGCRLPIEFWHIGKSELPAAFAPMLESLQVVARDAELMSETHPIRVLNGWTLKAFSIVHSAFNEVLFLDSDNVPVRNPEYLFDDCRYKKAGAMFWPDYGRLSPCNPIWDLLGLSYVRDREFESGQILVDKRKCWTSLTLALWLNNYPDIVYDYVLGDKETFHLAFLKMEQRFVMPAKDIVDLNGKCMCQHDLNGKRVFQHRNGDKWMMFRDNANLEGFNLERDCLSYASELRANPALTREMRDAVVPLDQRKTTPILEGRRTVSAALVKAGAYGVKVTLRADGIVIGKGGPEDIVFWSTPDDHSDNCLNLFGWNGLSAVLRYADNTSRWEGRFTDLDETPCTLSAIGDGVSCTSSDIGNASGPALSCSWVFRTKAGKLFLFKLFPHGCVVGLSELGIGFWRFEILDSRPFLILERPFDGILRFAFRAGEAWSVFEDEQVAVMPLKQHAPPITMAGLIEGEHLIPTQRWFESDIHTFWSGCIRETPRYHRMQWEYAALLQILESAGMLNSRGSGLCVLLKTEPVSAAIAKRCRSVHLSVQPEYWSQIPDVAKEEQSLDDLKVQMNDRGICPSQFFWERVSVAMFLKRGTVHEETLTPYDFAYGIGALNALASATDPLALIDKWLSRLKDGGIAVFTGDLLMASLCDGNKSPKSAPLFTLRRLKHFKAQLVKQGWIVSIPSLGDEGSVLDGYVDCEPYSSDIHYRLRRENTVITSALIVLTKK